MQRFKQTDDRRGQPRSRLPSWPGLLLQVLVLIIAGLIINVQQTQAQSTPDNHQAATQRTIYLPIITNKANNERVVAAAGPTLVLNTASVSADQDDSDTTNNGAASCLVVGAGTFILNTAGVSSAEASTGSNGTTAASCLALAAPDLLIGKSGPATATQGTAFAYTLVVTNTGTAATSGTVTVSDNLPTGLSFVSGGGFTCSASGQTVTCTSSTAIAVNGTATITLSVNPTTSGVKANTASVIGGGDTTSATSNTANTTVSVAATPNLVIGKSGPATATQGTAFAYTLVVTNTGTAATSGTVTVSDNLPTGLSFVSGSGGGFTCSASGQTVTCTSSTAIAVNGTATITLSVNPTTSGVKANTASVIGGGDTTSATSNTANTTVSVAATPNLVIGKSGPATATQGTAFAYTLVVTNTGTAATSGTVTVSDNLPTGLSFVSGSGGGFTCSASGQTVTCTSSTAIAVNGTATITLSVNPTTSGVKANTASVIGGGDTTSATSNTANTTVSVAATPNLVIGKSGPATATQGTAFAYTLVVTNTGTAATSGTVTVSDNLPTGLNFVSGSGGGFTCTASGQTVTCTSSTAIAVNGTATITLSVNPTTSGVKANIASVVGGGDTTSATSNTANTTVSVAATPNLVIGKSGPATATQGTAFAYTLVVTNTGTAATSGTVTVSDNLPTGLSFVSGSGGGFTCSASGQAVTCTSSTAIAVNGTATITLSVNPTTNGVKANIASVVGGGDTTSATSNTANTTVSVAATPNLVIGKSGPANATLNVSYTYTLTVNNTGSASTERPESIQQSVELGVYHTCLLPTSGGAQCWGVNFGVVGDGTTTDRSTPTTVSGLSSQPMNAIFADDEHTCAAPRGGGVKCWGYNTDSKLGDGTANDTLVPVDVVGLTEEVIALTGGYSYTCALTSQGAVKCWGNNSFGQLGDGTYNGSSVPVDVVGLSSGVKAIDGDDNLACALMATGGLKCWGTDYQGNSNPTPYEMPGLTANLQAFDIAWGHFCVLTDIGGIKCLGSNFSGQLGDGTTNDSFTPVDVVGLSSGVKAIAAGYFNSCAVMQNGGVKCWGYGTTTPTDVAGLSSGVNSVHLGYNHACALTTAGALKCWGNNTYGQLGDGTTTTRSVPVDVVGYSSGGAGITLSYPIIVTDTLPSGLTYSSGGNSDWSCSVTGQVVICESLAILNAGASSSFPVVVNPTTTGVKANTASVGGGGDTSVSASNTVNTTVNAPTSALTVPAKVFLGGAYDSTSGLMRDDLRSQNLLPTTSPYNGLAGTANASVFAVTGNNAIVDWVLVELRDPTTPTTVSASKVALVQRDGDVVDVDGVSPLSFTGLSGSNYYVVVKHRNHLGVMTSGPVALSSSTPVVDFTNPATAVYGTNARRIASSVAVLWSGNANGDTSVIGAGPNNDNNSILTTVLTAPANTLHLNNYVVNGYANGDVNLDGKVIGAGPNNDINFILYTVFVYPGNTVLAANYIVQQQLP